MGRHLFIIIFGMLSFAAMAKSFWLNEKDFHFNEDSFGYQISDDTSPNLLTSTSGLLHFSSSFQSIVFIFVK